MIVLDFKSLHHISMNIYLQCTSVDTDKSILRLLRPIFNLKFEFKNCLLPYKIYQVLGMFCFIPGHSNFKMYGIVVYQNSFFHLFIFFFILHMFVEVSRCVCGLTLPLHMHSCVLQLPLLWNRTAMSFSYLSLLSSSFLIYFDVYVLYSFSFL